MLTQLRFSFSSPVRRLLHLLFAGLFLLYVTGALLWLLFGLIVGVAAAWEGFYRMLAAAAQMMDHRSWPAYLIRTMLFASWYAQPPVNFVFYYLFSLVNLAAALAMVWLRPRDWVPRILAIGMVGTAAVFNWPAHAVLEFTVPAISAWHDYYHIISGFAYALGLLVFPDGAFPDLPFPRRLSWPTVRKAIRLGYVLVILTFGLAIANLTDGEPFGLVFFFGVAVPLIGITAQMTRYRQARDEERRQQIKVLLLSLVLSLGAALLMILVGALLTLPDFGLTWEVQRRFEGFSFVIFPLLFTTIPIMLFVTVVRYRLWDFDFLINRSLVYGTLTGAVVVVYMVAVGLLSALFQANGYWPFSILATGLIALLFHPLRLELQRAVNRLMYGQRDEPVQVLGQLGRQLAATVSPDDILPTIVRTIGQALKVPYVAIGLQQGEAAPIVARWGEATSAVEQFPLHYQHELLGCLLVAPRHSEERLTAGDRHLLQQIAHQAGAAIHALQLMSDLRRSREQLVTAREEERRRLRRDLHDGLGPQLATLTLKIDAARNLLQQDPVQADRLLAEYRAQTQAALTDLRRVVHDLRPPTLDQLGLLSALRQQLALAATGSNLQIELDAPESLPALPAAVEVAAYHIGLEALTNAIRHAAAQRCTIALRLAGSQLELTVCDDGKGLSPDYVAGVGLRSMRERAEELGGVFTLRAGAEGGTQLFVQLPI